MAITSLGPPAYLGLEVGWGRLLLHISHSARCQVRTRFLKVHIGQSQGPTMEGVWGSDDRRSRRSGSGFGTGSGSGSGSGSG